MGNCCNSNNSSIDWTKYNFDNTNEFSLNELYLECRVVDIYDGDTCTCVLPLFDNYYKFKVRLADIDTCEMKSKGENKIFANKARICLYNLVINSNSKTKLDLDSDISRKEMRALLNKNVYLIRILCGKFDKYGRLLGHLFKSDELKISTIHDILTKSFNHELVKRNFAYLYKGDTKLTEVEQIDFLSI